MKKQCRVFIFFIALLIFITSFSAFTLTTAITHHTHHPGPPQSHLKPSSISPLEYNTKLLKPSVSKDLKDRRISVNPLSNTAENAAPVCDLQGFANKQGTALAEHILSMNISCLKRLRRDAELSIRIRAFRSQNMLSIAEITEQQAHSYNGTNELLRNYYLYLHTGYYNHRHHNEDMDWLPNKKSQIDRAMISALTAFMENPHFYDISTEHGIVLREVFIATEKAQLQVHFLPFYKEYLKQFNQNYVNQEYMDFAVNEIFIALHQGHLHSDFQSAAVEDRELILILRNFALSDWMLGTSVEWLAGNAALELARFLQYDEVSIYPEAVSAVQGIFNRYDFFSGPGFEISIWVLKNVLQFEKCEEFQVCGVKEQLKNHVFSRGQYACHQVDVVIQSQDNVREEQLMNTCEILAEQEMYFHEKLMTHQRPVEDDFNEVLEAVIFRDAHNYRLYSDLFFGNSTNNGGVYSEGNPLDPSNTARTITYIDYGAEWSTAALEHEHIHYLDSRYNLYGTFSSLPQNAGAVITWWVEGLAEYISKKDANPEAFTLLFESSQIPALSQIFKTTYWHSVDFIYRWSYFAIRFMFEEHLEEVTRLLQYFRAGQYDEYAEYLNTSIGSKYNTEFSEWLEGLKNTHIHARPLNVPEHIADNHNFRRIDLSSYFSSTQDLSFSVTSSNPSALQAEIVEGRFLILKPRLLGVSEITITAQSSDSSTQVNMTITVVRGIRIFTGQFSEPLSIFEKTRTIDLSKYVEGPPKEDIIFTVESLNPDIASVRLEGSLLTITALKAGTASIEFRATYENIGSRYTFRVDIIDGGSIAQGYCYSEPVNTQQGYIVEMSLAGRRIADHRNKVYSLGSNNDIIVFTDSSYTLDVTVGTASSTNNEDRTHRVEAWVDWNEDTVFSNETERVMDEQIVLSNTNIFKKASSVLKAPESTEQGYKRLRVRISDTQENYSSACSDYESGEIEDHLVWVYPGTTNIEVNNIDGEKQSVLKIKTSIKEVPLSEVFYTHDNSVLTYSAVSSDPDTAEVQIEDEKLIIRKASSAENFEPVGVTVRAEISTTGRTAEKEFSVVFEPYTLPLVLSAVDARRESFVRIINNSNQGGVVHITGRDDSGRVRGPISLSLTARGSAHFNSGDLEKGNTDKGLTGSLGSGRGNWRLTLESDLEFHASSYIRLKGEGFVTSMNELVELKRNGESYTYFVPIFNPTEQPKPKKFIKTI